MYLLKIFFYSFSIEVIFFYVLFICLVIFTVFIDLKCSVHVIIDLSFSLSERYNCFTLPFIPHTLSFPDQFCWLFSIELLLDFLDFSFPVFSMIFLSISFFIDVFHYTICVDIFISFSCLFVLSWSSFRNLFLSSLISLTILTIALLNSFSKISSNSFLLEDIFVGLVIFG